MPNRLLDLPVDELAHDGKKLVDDLITRALAAFASDIHIDPSADGYTIKFRIDGLMQSIAAHSREAGRMIVTRLMVMAKLLTYRPDVPQEGRATVIANNAVTELRVSIMPTMHGPRCAVRLPADLLQPQSLEELMLPASVIDGLQRFVRADSGMLILTGPAGSGKTTTIYALLRHLAKSSNGISIVTLEDPVERDLTRDGIVQIEVSPFGQLTYERALRSILRQDPQVLMLGEIRDAATASIAVQAVLSGHRLICTLHAADPAGAIVRLLEMGVEPYQLSSAIFGIATQRLARRRCEISAGYRGRVPVAEFAAMDAPLRSALLARADLGTLRNAYQSQPYFQPLASSAAQLVTRGLTDHAEILRVLGEANPL